jgi:hypothetical protein
MVRHTMFFLAALSGVVCFGVSNQTARRRTPIIRQVDHILIETGDPQSLFSFFSDTLELPVAWSLAHSKGFESGGIGAGNVNLELFQYTEQKRVPARRNPEARYAGLAFQPYPLSESLRELDVSGIPYDSPKPTISTLPDGSQGTAWTTVSLPSLSRPGMAIFLYEYSPVFLRVEVRRKQLGNRLALTDGGPLGFQSIPEIVITTTHMEKDKAVWGELLGNRISQDSWRAGSGPAIHLIPGSSDRLSEIIFKVKSLERARSFLDRNQLLGAVSSKELFLNASKIQGLKIRIVE